MSADNGVYILQTPLGSGHEYRVAHLGNIENLDWDTVLAKYWHDVPDSDRPQEFSDNEQYGDWVRIVNAQEMFRDARVFETGLEAVNYANELMADPDMWACEYGICDIEIPLCFYAKGKK